MKPRVLVACEFSGIVREAFSGAGWDAHSCDLLPTEKPSANHYTGDVADIIRAGWDLLIAFPPCTHLAVSGARWFTEKQKEQKEALAFVDNVARRRDTANRRGKSGFDHFVPRPQAGSDNPAVAIWAWRNESNVPLA